MTFSGFFWIFLNFGTFLQHFWKDVRTILDIFGTFWDISGNILGTFGNILGTFENIFGNIWNKWETFRKPEKTAENKKDQEQQQNQNNQIFKVLSSRYLRDHLATWVYLHTVYLSRGILGFSGIFGGGF